MGSQIDRAQRFSEITVRQVHGMHVIHDYGDGLWLARVDGDGETMVTDGVTFYPLSSVISMRAKES